MDVHCDVAEHGQSPGAGRTLTLVVGSPGAGKSSGVDAAADRGIDLTDSLVIERDELMRLLLDELVASGLLTSNEGPSFLVESLVYGVEVDGNAHDIVIGGPQPTFNIIPHNAISANGSSPFPTTNSNSSLSCFSFGKESFLLATTCSAVSPLFLAARKSAEPGETAFDNANSSATFP